jgi:hypothetical protein
MGFFKLFLLTTAGSTFLAFSLGNRLPVVARRTGRSVGMYYNYLKIALKHLTPKTAAPVQFV